MAWRQEDQDGIAGRIPDVFGVVANQQGRLKRNNTLAGMYGPTVYMSHYTNTAYAGALAMEASRVEVHSNRPYIPNSPVYGIAPHGLPMNPLWVNHLNDLAQSPAYKDEDRMQAYELLQVLRLVAKNTWPEDRDHTMHHLLMADAFRDGIPILDTRQQGGIPIIEQPATSLSGNTHNALEGAGLPMPSNTELMRINQVCQYITHHGHPESHNHIMGIAIDFRFQINHAYPYGLHYLEGHYTGTLFLHSLLDSIDNECLRQLDKFGEPPAIPKWAVPQSGGSNNPPQAGLDHETNGGTNVPPDDHQMDKAGDMAPPVDSGVVMFQTFATIAVFGLPGLAKHGLYLVYFVGLPFPTQLLLVLMVFAVWSTMAAIVK
ncbi:hypothetical protein BDQ17DRAFT_1327306 [Cyathus striatus]|nr:hypothetical protein BDQ17DRAFT_1327306 [Cyathus striatus]